MSFVNILLSVPDSATSMNSIYLQIPAALNQFSALGLVNMLSDMIDGAQVSYTTVSNGMIQAIATMTSTGTATNGETALIANVTLTAKTSGAVLANGEFNISAVVATQAANIAAAINAVPALSGIVTATSALGVTTITAVKPGKAGNGLQISEGLTNVTATAFASGSDGSQVSANFGAAS